MLISLGFFDLLGVKFSDENPQYAKLREVIILRMVTGDGVPGETVDKIQKEVNQIANASHQNPMLYGALSEAAYNSFLHAYPDEHEYEFPPLKKRWWATACWYPKESIVQFIIYDQGVGIPETLPRSKNWENIREYIGKIPIVRGLANDDSLMIEAAIEITRTSRGGGHGKGLQDIVAPIRNIQGGKVRILSGRGLYMCSSDGQVEKSDVAHHIGGTLIGWDIPVGVNERGVEQ